MNRPESRSFIILIAIILLQLVFPACQIFRHESALTDGSLYRFKVAFKDPHDPLQGRYIQLTYDIDYPDDVQIHPDSRYAVLATSDDGFARFTEILLNKPEGSADYVAVTIEYGTPVPLCDRFYLEESVAPEAERFFLTTLSDSKTPVWADVRVKDGHAVIESIRVDGVPLLEAMRENGA